MTTLIHNRQRLAVFLMALSLGLLLVFLLLFLKKVYNDELDTLQRESSLLFVNAVRGIEGEMFDKIILRDIKTNGDSMKVRISSSLLEEKEVASTLRLPKAKPGDSVQILMYRQEEHSPTRIRRDAQWRVQLPEGSSMTSRPDMQGSLSMIVAMSDKRFSRDSLGPPPLDTAQIFALLQRDFGQAIQKR